MVDYKKLNFLRKHTLIGPFEFIKVRRMRYDAEEKQILINKLENCQIEVDFSEADEYEYNVRFKAWMEDLYVMWHEHSDGLDLYDFANLVIEQNLEREKEELGNEIIRQRIK